MELLSILVIRSKNFKPYRILEAAVTITINSAKNIAAKSAKQNKLQFFFFFFVVLIFSAEHEESRQRMETKTEFSVNHVSVTKTTASRSRR